MSKHKANSKGMVSLVGAGPGDPGLLTVKGLQRIKEADLIIYDYLVNPEHLEHAKPSAVKIGTGKGFRHHRLTQQKINRLIVNEAKKGRKVVRLKGGDPYLFGRGGEEALFLSGHQIPFEVVPGVTSATACAAYAGVPLTHRDHNASVTFLTGHRADDSDLSSVDWTKLVRLNGTLVIYMGFYNLKKITEKLKSHGMAADTKVCVIQWGTLPRQRSCQGTLETIHRIVSQKKLGAPSLIIIGEVVSLKQKLGWYEKLPLFGKRILITRPRDKAGVLKEKLRALGAWAIELPAIEIKPPKSFKEMDRAIQNIRKYDWLIFTSTYGVEAFFGRLFEQNRRDARTLSSIKIACVGPETKAALRKYGLSADLEPKQFETAALASEFKRKFGSLKEKQILLCRTNIAPPELEKDLKGLGAGVTRVTAYRTVRPSAISKKLKGEIMKGGLDYVTFTSASTVANTANLLGAACLKDISRRSYLASIGPVTSKALRTHKLKPDCQAKIYTIDGLIHAIISHAKKHKAR